MEINFEMFSITRLKIVDRELSFFPANPILKINLIALSILSTNFEEIALEGDWENKRPDPFPGTWWVH